MDPNLSVYDFYERDWESLAALREAFEWRLPETFNAFTALCDVWTGDERVALAYEDRTQDREGELTFADLDAASARLAGYLRERDLEEGDFVAITLAQKPETIVTHLAAWRLGAVSAPLSVLFGPEGLAYRLSDCEPAAAVVDRNHLGEFRTACGRIDDPPHRIVVGDPAPDAEGDDHREVAWDGALDGRPVTEVAETATDDPMVLMYSSGTTGPPKGIVQPHRSVIGHFPGSVANYYNLDPRDDEVWWTPSDWAWGAFLSMLIDAYSFGRPIVGVETDSGFDPGRALEVLERYGVTHAFLPPSALRMLRTDAATNTERSFPEFRLVVSAGESLDAESRTWTGSYFDVTVHEAYGATEMFNHVIGDCTALEPGEPDVMGYTLPGHEIALLDTETGEPVDPGEPGEIALRRDDPVLFDGYLDRPEATADTYHGDWYLSGDVATRNEDGQFRFVSRKDDLIISAGYRIGPDEIEDVLVGHDAVADAGVVGVPDEERGEIPRAYVELASGQAGDEDLRETLKEFVRGELAAYEYPREVVFVDSLPRTTSGKVKRAALGESDERIQ